LILIPSQNLIGIDIGSSMIKMVEVSTKETLKPVKWTCVENLSGGSLPTRDPDKELIKKLRGCLRKLRTSTRIASICLSDPAVVLKELTLPLMGEKEILENVRFELAEYFLSDFKDYQISYRILDDSRVKDKVSLLVAAAPYILLNKYRDIVQASGLKLKYIDIPDNCRSKLLTKMVKVSDTNNNSEVTECLCIVDLGNTNIDISIFEDTKFCLSRMIPVQDSSYDEAVLYELSQVIDYYYRKNNEKKFDRIILTGGRSYADGLAENIAKQLFLQVEVVRPDMFVTFGEGQQGFPMALYFNALGCTLRED